MMCSTFQSFFLLGSLGFTTKPIVRTIVYSVFVHRFLVFTAKPIMSSIFNPFQIHITNKLGRLSWSTTSFRYFIQPIGRIYNIPQITKISASFR